MLLIDSQNTDPYFNIAAEEFLLKQKNEEIFILYVNSPSVIIGKHQNALSEINYQYVKENNIPVIRRISGGGTVYHDLGNLNFTIITNGQSGQLIDFNRSTLPVRKALEKSGIKTTNEGKNNLCVNGLKISGNAAHVYKNRVMHHGTLLVSTDLKKLHHAISVIPGKYVDNGVKSIRSNILNLETVNGLTIESLRKAIIDEVNKEERTENYFFSKSDSECINKLITEKYSTWEWNFGYSPNYEFINKEPEIYLKVENGIIIQAKVYSLNNLSERIIGKRHNFSEIISALGNKSNFTYKGLTELTWKFF